MINRLFTYIFIMVVSGVVVLANIQPDKLPTMGDWGYFILALQLLALGEAGALLTAKSSKSISLIWMLNPFSIFALSVNSIEIFMLLLIIPRLILLLRLIFSKWSVRILNILWRLSRIQLNLLLITIFIIIFLLFLSQDGSFVSQINLAYFIKGWSEYIKSPIVIISLIGLAVSTNYRIALAVVGNHNLVVRITILLSTLLFLVLSSLPIYNAQLILEPNLAEKPYGWESFQSFEPNENILLIQKTATIDNVFLVRTGSLAPAIQLLTQSNVVDYTTLEADLSASILLQHNINRVIIIESNSAEAESKELTVLRAIAKEVTSQKDSRVFEFLTSYENLNFEEDIPTTSLDADDWDYQKQLAIRGSEMFFNRNPDNSYEISLDYLGHSETLGEFVPRNINSNKTDFYISINQNLYGFANNLQINKDVKAIKLLQVYERYDNTNILDLVKFSRTPEITVETQATSLIQLKGELKSTKNINQFELCIYSLSSNKCIANYKLEDFGKEFTRTFEMPTIEPNAKLQLRLKRITTGDFTTKLTEFDKLFKRLRVSEWELTTSWEYEQAIEVPHVDYTDVDIARYEQCDLELSEQVAQSVVALDSELRIAASSQSFAERFCIAYNIEDADLVKINSQIYTRHQLVEAEKVGESINLSSQENYPIKAAVVNNRLIIAGTGGYVLEQLEIINQH